MSTADIRNVASLNFRTLKRMAYPGRGIVVGITNNGTPVQMYWIGGRSENSQNRVLSCEGTRVFTEGADPAKVKDPSLIIYDAMIERSDLKGSKRYGVSNGRQTRDLVKVHRWGLGGLDDALMNWQYEPDEPNFTPRISAMISISTNLKISLSMASLRKSPLNSDCDRSLHQLSGQRGYGHCLTTYTDTGISPSGTADDPLKAYCNDPMLVPLEGSIGAIADAYWSALNEKTRVALAVKAIDPKTLESRVEIINRFKKVT